MNRWGKKRKQLYDADSKEIAFERVELWQFRLDWRYDTRLMLRRSWYYSRLPSPSGFFCRPAKSFEWDYSINIISFCSVRQRHGVLFLSILFRARTIPPSPTTTEVAAPPLIHDLFKWQTKRDKENAVRQSSVTSLMMKTLQRKEKAKKKKKRPVKRVGQDLQEVPTLLFCLLSIFPLSRLYRRITCADKTLSSFHSVNVLTVKNIKWKEKWLENEVNK